MHAGMTGSRSGAAAWIAALADDTYVSAQRDAIGGD